MASCWDQGFVYFESARTPHDTLGRFLVSLVLDPAVHVTATPRKAVKRRHRGRTSKKGLKDNMTAIFYKADEIQVNMGSK